MRKGLTVVVIWLALFFAGGIATAAPKQILLPEDASETVRFAASEARRYIYLRTGKLLPIVVSDEAEADAIIIGSMSYVPAAERLAPVEDTPWDHYRLDQEYLVKTVSFGEHKLLVLAGASDTATLYAVYRFAEILGVRFALHGDIIPDKRRKNLAQVQSR